MRDWLELVHRIEVWVHLDLAVALPFHPVLSLSGLKVCEVCLCE